MTMLKVQSRETDDYLLLMPQQDLTDDVVDDFGILVKEQFKARDKDVLLDFEKTLCLSSRAITLLIGLYKHCRSFGHSIGLARVNHELQRLLDEINVSSIVPIFDSEEEFVVWAASNQGLGEDSTRLTASIGVQRQIAIIKLDSSPDDDAPGLEDCIDKIDKQKVVIDCSRIQRMDEPSISALIVFADLLRKRNGALVLASLDKSSQALFQVIGIEGVFAFAGSVEEATEMLRA